MSASSPAGSENSPHGPKRVGMGEKIVRFVFKTAVYGMFSLFGLGILAIFIAPAVQTGGASPRLECLNNMRQVGLALHSYHAEHGSFPPAYVADDQGRPLYSWRVLLLPYLERGTIYGDFHLNETWDSPHNRELIKGMPSCFRCPTDPRKDSYFVNFVAVTGSGTVFDGSKACRLSDITDGADKTILLVESADSDIVWSEPRDLLLVTLNLRINADRNGFSSKHGSHGAGPTIWNLWLAPSPVPSGANAILCNGHGRFLPNTVPPEKLRALITINAGELLSDDF